ncbi:MAG TPA: hypothetical protein VNF99_05210 [Stellaceae bacterium]|nr:hypothetical protein [Stellaceae bacterium]
MRRLAILAAGALWLGTPAFAAADENNDLNLIPGAAATESSAAAVVAAAAATAHGKFYLEDAITDSSQRSGLVVPYPAPPIANWQNRTSLDALDTWNLGADLSATLSNRLNLLEENDFNIVSRQTVRNDFREGYLTWEPLARNYLDAGRINVRNGVALGFNPTDFFKTRTAVGQASLDPSVTREDRLGTVMLHDQAIWDSGSASIAFAPKFYSSTPITDSSRLGIDPLFDRTNSADRLLATFGYDIADLSPQALVYHEGNETKFGLNLSHPVGQSVIAYAEASTGKQRDLIADAIAYGKKTAVLPSSAPILPSTDPVARFRSDLAAGVSWTPVAKFTVNAEYHFHQAGLSGRDWQNWFATGAAHAGVPAITKELWYVRGYANAEQEPLTRQEAFFRADWTDAFVTDLELTAITFVDLYDGSTLSQLTAQYYLSDAWTIGGYLSANLGGERSERGSFPQAASATLQIDRYF